MHARACLLLLGLLAVPAAAEDPGVARRAEEAADRAEAAAQRSEAAAIRTERAVERLERLLDVLAAQMEGRARHHPRSQ